MNNIYNSDYSKSDYSKFKIENNNNNKNDKIENNNKTDKEEESKQNLKNRITKRNAIRNQPVNFDVQNNEDVNVPHNQNLNIPLPNIVLLDNTQTKTLKTKFYSIHNLFKK